MDAKERILEAAFKEFAAEGFGGARMDRIARNAKINKAMIFYYFTSKENLYQSVLTEVMMKIFGPLSGLLAEEDDPEVFLEKMPAMYINFLSQNQEFVRILILDQIRSPENIKTFFAEFFKQNFDKGPGRFMEKIKRWHSDGLVTESDPRQFIINVMSLSIFPFIGRPIFEVIFNSDLDAEGNFSKDRIASVVNLLKQGMLK